MKKIISIVLATFMLLSSSFYNSNVFASNNSILSYSSKSISSMSDEIYLKLLNNYYITEKKCGKDLNEMKKELKSVGIEFDSGENSGMLRAASISTDIALDIYTSRRSGQSYTYVTATATSTRNLTSPGTEDAMSIEWNPSKGTYYGYTETQNTTLKNASKRNNGVLVFNVQDVNMIRQGQYALASAKVIFSNNNNRGCAAVHYVHTYSDNAPTLSIGGNVGYSTNGPTGGATFGLSVSTVNCVWERECVKNL